MKSPSGGNLSTFEFRRESTAVAGADPAMSNKLMTSQATSIKDMLNEAKFAQRNDPSRMSGQELLRQFKQQGLN